jgi:hypothetical protein
LEILARKYQKFPLSTQFYSNRHLSLGVLYCYAGKLDQAKQAFRTAIKLCPLAARVYLYLFLALLGERTFKKINDKKETLSIVFRRLLLQMVRKGKGTVI